MPTARDATWSIDDVIEASGKLPAEALQAALTEVRHGFDMNKTHAASRSTRRACPTA